MVSKVSYVLFYCVWRKTGLVALLPRSQNFRAARGSQYYVLKNTFFGLHFLLIRSALGLHFNLFWFAFYCFQNVDQFGDTAMQYCSCSLSEYCLLP